MTVVGCLCKHILSRQSLQKVHRYTMANLSTKDLFTNSKQVQCYAEFRPGYTDNVYERIVGFCKEGSCVFKLAVDVGCGSGQSTVPLAKYFQKVVGFDVSEQQIANAPKNNPGLSFHVSAAENLSSIEDSSADLVTIAQAFHWVDRDKFFEEVDRILRPGGTLAVFGYGNCELEPSEGNRVFQYLYEDVLGKYWSQQRRMVEEKYMNVKLPYPGWIRDDSLGIVKNCTIAEFIGYLESWSALAQYYKTHPNSKIVKEVEHRLQNICYKGNMTAVEDKPVLKVTWPVFMLLGHKPK